ncbi:TlpA family protein disulfide reductase [Paractinoplanes rishiriensis]|uniref:TlpA family protein disulfide reductase n=1 Tax=Paractinoplanes rishiriensis TaxID=1050105 RepID=UPI003F68E4F4
MPDLRLACFTGGAEVSLRALRGPAVINLWGSYCEPCRRELPVMQRLADVAGDRITVLGVNTFDAREAGASFAEAVGVSMPTLFDPDRRLSDALGGTAMPLTVVVDSSGRSLVHRLPLDAPKLAELVRSHTGVQVTL